MWRAWMIGLGLLASASCGKKGASCADQKRAATAAVTSGKTALELAKDDHGRMAGAKAAVAKLAAFEKKLTDGIAALAPYGCDAMICCKNVKDWIDANTKVDATERPIWRLPEYGLSEEQPDALTSDLTTYDHGVDRLAIELVKGKAATLKAATEACEQANDAIGRLKAASPVVFAAAHAKADRELAALEDEAVQRDKAIALMTPWVEAITSGAKVDLGTPTRDDPKPLTEARMAMEAVQGCSK